MKKIRIILMFLLTLPLLGQAQKTWTGAYNRDWSTATNWTENSLPTTIPASTDDVIIPVVTRQPIVDALYPPLAAVCNNLTINAGAIVTINSRKALTVSGTLSGAGRINIKSDENGTGSLTIAIGSGSFLATAERWMEAGKWNMIASPVPGQLVSDFLTKNANVSTKGANRGMMDFIPASNIWNTFFINTTGGNLEKSKGFSMRTDVSSIVTFSGSLQYGDQAINTVTDSWNCIGNPYTSAIQIGGGVIATNFLTENLANIDANYGGIYVWDKGDGFNTTPGSYTAVSNASGDYQLQMGQGFFVKMNTIKNSVSFKPAMQIHSTELALKSTKGVWPTIKLVASVNNMKSSTIIAFNGSMTKGLDPTYDAGLFTGGADLAVYTRLVEDSGIPFAIQALPDNDYKNMVIPVGIDAKTGGEVIFSAELLNLPSECKVILEDKVTKTFTDLSKDNYKVAVVANSTISDRFQLHTSDMISRLGTETLAGKLTAYAIRNTEIRVVGEVNNNATAKLYNLQGSTVLIENLKAGNLNVIPTANLKNGIYMLSVEDQGKIQTFKLLIRE